MGNTSLMAPDRWWSCMVTVRVKGAGAAESEHRPAGCSARPALPHLGAACAPPALLHTRHMSHPHPGHRAPVASLGPVPESPSCRPSPVPLLWTYLYGLIISSVTKFR